MEIWDTGPYLPGEPGYAEETRDKLHELQKEVKSLKKKLKKKSKDCNKND